MKLNNFTEFSNLLRKLDYERGRDFSTGVEIGFGEWDNPVGRILRRKSLFEDKDIPSRFLAGIEYGELLAENAGVSFLSESRLKYCETAKCIH